jgi:hypothetical protein
MRCKSLISQFGRPDTDTPYLHDAIADGVGGFMKTKTAERCADMFPRNDKGNIEATIPVVALTCAGVSLPLSDGFVYLFCSGTDLQYP